MKDEERYWDCLDQAMEASHTGRTEEALAWLDEALRADPNGAEARNGRGEFLWDAGRVESALFEFERATQADSKFIVAYLNRAELLLEEFGEFERTLAFCDELLSGASKLPRLDRSVESEIYYLKARACFYLDDLPGALFLVRRAMKSGGERGLCRAFEGQVLFELGQFRAAQSSLQRAVILDPELAHAFYYYGLVSERLEKEDEAAQAFSAADALDPEHYPLPMSTKDEGIQQYVAAALENLPRSIRKFIEKIPVVIAPFPSLEMMREEDIAPQILGVFLKTPEKEDSSKEANIDHEKLDFDLDAETEMTLNVELGRIFLFQKNFEKVCKDRTELIEQIQMTIRHEVGHHLGLDENDLDRLGL